ncbi:hypothetical protein [Pontibacter flavimaris]|uniref:STAS/SEC14 domain-containing protein n=1 Tax=Pontibacter flavimaris TaxID=1797110 RepID=A0A1Q5P866_9BACT|nr:hypothetical protein [Pontibacter flavimaris]OKL38437.1 hypothetical protein A3841_06895 [Pontibacter flavimaris]
MPAPRVVLFNEPELLIYMVPKHQLMVVQANGVVPSATYRQGLQAATDAAIEGRLKYWLINNRAGGIISPDDQNWANEVIAPQLAYKTAIAKMAIIEPEDVLSHLILEGMMDEGRNIFPFQMQFFEKIEDAYVWFGDSDLSLGL